MTQNLLDNIYLKIIQKRFLYYVINCLQDIYFDLILMNIIIENHLLIEINF